MLVVWSHSQTSDCVVLEWILLHPPFASPPPFLIHPLPAPTSPSSLVLCHFPPPCPLNPSFFLFLPLTFLSPSFPSFQLLCIIVEEESDIAAFKDYQPPSEDVSTATTEKVRQTETFNVWAVWRVCCCDHSCTLVLWTGMQKLNQLTVYQWVSVNQLTVVEQREWGGTSFTSADQTKVSNELPLSLWVTHKELILRRSNNASCEGGSSNWLCLHHGQPSACIAYRLHGFLWALSSVSRPKCFHTTETWLVGDMTGTR